MYGPAVRCKRISSICRRWVLHQCIRPLVGAACAPGHHGCQRACVLITGQASTGHLGHQGSHAPGRPVLHLVSSSRRPRRETGLCHRFLPHQFLCLCRQPFLRPGLLNVQGAARRSCQGWPLLRPPAGLGLDGPEHGATLTQVGMTLQWSARIRSCAPC